EVDLLAASLRPEGRAELEGNLAPVSQLPVCEVQAELFPGQARVEGQLRLTVRNREQAPWSEVVLRTYPNAQRRTSLRVDSVQVDGKSISARSHGTVVSVPAHVAPGQWVVISLQFHGSLRRLREADADPQAQVEEMMAQFGPGLAALSGRPKALDRGYGTFAVSPSGAALVDWYPQLAARAHGAWDREEPAAIGDVGHADPGSAVVALTVPKGWRVAGAGSALGQHPTDAAHEQATFAAAAIRGALGIAASFDYEEVAEDMGAVRVRASSVHGHSGAKALVSCAMSALSSLQKRFGPYPWATLTLAEVSLSGGAGGLELPAMALIGQGLAPRAGGPIAPSGLFEFTCYHEVAHQWWQAVVGSDPNRTPWVDEALAQYSAALVTEDVAGKAAADQALGTFVALNYHGMRLARLPDAKVARAAGDFHSPLAYAGLIYGKAPLFFQKARELLGDDGFNQAARAYRQAWAFREAGGSSWLAAAQRTDPAHGAEIAALQKRWWEERHGDEDIPQPDAVGLMGALGGGAGASLSQLLRAMQGDASMDDPQVRDALKQLERLMPELSRMLQDPQSP
ncbi:MAG TPA: hypothetical protein VLW85_13430, partial [Myxococcales bacterium]|nr:hypothetical protein [Myxococcales bacterium]